MFHGLHLSLEGALFAFFFGALHALEPGHGKTALLAYMLDGRAKKMHAIVVGLTSGISHSISILAIAAIVHTVSDVALHNHGTFSEAMIISWASSLILLAIGLYLLYQSLVQKKKSAHNCCGHHHSSDNHHHSSKKKFSVTALLGLSVGLYPCPTAIAAYLSSVNSGDFMSGYLAIFVYAVGIAFAVSSVGMLSMWLGKKFHNANHWMTHKANYLGIAQASIIIVVSLHLIYKNF